VLSKNPFQTILLSGFILLSLYRPILIEHQSINVIYGLFVISFIILLFNINLVKHIDYKLLVLLALSAFFPVFASMLFHHDIPLDKIGLILFLPISFLLGVWLEKKGSIHLFFRFAAVLFIVIGCYIFYRLALSDFSYNYYYNWGNAQYRIDYLTSSLYAFIICTYFLFNGRNFLEKYGVTLFCLIFIVMSGARYTILFLGLTIIYLLIKVTQKNPIKLVATLVGSSIVMLLVLFFKRAVVYDLAKMVSYSLFRIGNLAGQDNSLDGRVDLINKSIDIISNNFLVGVGVGGSGDALHSNYPHNMLIEIFIDGGFFAFLCLSIFFILSFYKIYKAKSTSKMWLPIIVVYLAGAYLKSFSIYDSRILFFFLGFALAMSSMVPKKNRHRVDFHAKN